MVASNIPGVWDHPKYSTPHATDYIDICNDLKGLEVDVYDIHEDLALVGMDGCSHEAHGVVCELLDAQDRIARILLALRRAM